MDELTPEGGNARQPEHAAAAPPAKDARPKRRRRQRRRSVCGCAALFALLCVLAAVGNYFTRDEGRFASSSGKIGQVLRHLPTIISTPDSVPTVPDDPHRHRPAPHKLPGDLTGTLEILTPVMKERFEPALQQTGVAWPPRRVRLVGLKLERQLELWVAGKDGQYKLLKTYPVLAASGTLGPKRREGDKQVPEGHYRFTHLNASSKFHLSLLLDYPNKLDREREVAGLKKGASLGGEICVHGSSISIGCLAIGDPEIEEVFTLVALAEVAHRDIIIMPTDLRQPSDIVSLAGNDTDLIKLYTLLTELGGSVSGPAAEPGTAVAGSGGKR